MKPLSQPFRYRIEFTSADHAISKEMMLMKAASPDAAGAGGSGLRHQCSSNPCGWIQGVVTGFETAQYLQGMKRTTR
ncbi:hypothetical protein LNQ03_32510 [Klebsiella pneumoniae subsp. pneumoniae]|nr:hypothetical protein [Klebsiella pneumoniae subsp. pneumoniae]